MGRGRQRRLQQDSGAKAYFQGKRYTGVNNLGLA